MLSGVNVSSRLKPEQCSPSARVRRWGRAASVAGLLASPAHVLAVEASAGEAGVAASSASASSASASSASASSASASSASASSASAVAPWARAYAQGHWSAAIELLEAIPEASRTAWHWLHLARALEKRTRLVEAFGAYERLHDLAAEGTDLPGMKDVERQARTESGALSHRIPWAEVHIGGDLPLGALVFVDQQWLDPARLRSPYPVNPGWHTFLVESNGVVLAARRTFFEEGQTRLVPLTSVGSNGVPFDSVASGARSAPALSSGAVRSTVASSTSSTLASSTLASSTLASSAPAAGSVDASGVAASEPAPGRRALTWRPGNARFDADRQESLLTATYVSLGVGSVGMVVGTGFLIAALNTPEPQRSCSQWGCTTDNGDATSAFRARAGAATMSYAVGAAGLITSGVLWALHGKREARSTVTLGQVELEPRIHPTGASLRGTF